MGWGFPGGVIVVGGKEKGTWDGNTKRRSECWGGAVQGGPGTTELQGTAARWGETSMGQLGGQNVPHVVRVR